MADGPTSHGNLRLASEQVPYGAFLRCVSVLEMDDEGYYIKKSLYLLQRNSIVFTKIHFRGYITEIQISQGASNKVLTVSLFTVFIEPLT